MARFYRGVLNIDYTDQNPNDYQKLVAALQAAGWMYVETSAFAIETPDLGQVWRGIELVAKQDSTAGTLSALTYHIQSSENFEDGKQYAATANHPNALEEVLRKEFPRPA